MTDSDSTNFGESGAASTSESEPNFRRKLENRATSAEARAEVAEAKLASYERQDTFRSAGIDLNDPRVKYFVKGYEGELDVDAIRMEAEAAGFLNNEIEPSSQLVANDALVAEQRIQAAGEGGDPVSPTNLDAQIRATTDQDQLRALMESQGIHWGASA
tara:strand:+ start:15235 stop:15711 length:477 start_codon:yes stop_codon:yes gene_type:complete